MLLEAAEDEAREPDDKGKVATKRLEHLVERQTRLTILYDCLRLDELQHEGLECQSTFL